MLVSLFSYSQYPTVKTIGNDSVVIMTLKQGQEINKKFSFLSDSIKVLNDRFINSKLELKKLSIEKTKLDSNLLLLNQNFMSLQNDLLVSDKEIKRLNKYIIDQDKGFYRERREWAVWMLLSMGLTVLIASGK